MAKKRTKAIISITTCIMIMIIVILNAAESDTFAEDNVSEHVKVTSATGIEKQNDKKNEMPVEQCTHHCIQNGQINICSAESGFVKNISFAEADESSENPVKTINSTGDSESEKAVVDDSKKKSKEIIDVEVKYKNREALLSWGKISDASAYVVYRKVPGEKKWTKVVKTKKTTYSDRYSRFKKKKQKKLLRKKKYIDPSENSVKYKVSAVDGKGKIILDNGDAGACNIIQPVVLSVTKSGNCKKVCWAKVPNAKKYVVYAGKKNKKGIKDQGDITWQEMKTIKAHDGLIQKTSVKKGFAYYSVAALYNSNRKTVSSTYEKSFSVLNKNHQNKKIICIGDSVASGVPYKGKKNKLFTFMHRIHELTGAEAVNESVPGATFTVMKHRNRMVKVANKINFKKYNVVVISCGSNDFAFDAKLGSRNGKNTHTFNGSINTIMTRIKRASTARVNSGSSPIKVIFVDMYYSSLRTNHKNRRHIKFSTYQKLINDAVNKYNSSTLRVYRMMNSQIVNRKNAAYKSVDNLHMTKNVYAEMGAYLSRLMIDNKMI